MSCGNATTTRSAGESSPTGSATGPRHHPGYNLAKRLHDKAEQVWLFTRQLKIPWTNNASEQALKAPKRHQAVSGYWHTTTTLAGYCRVRSYLTTARNNGLRAIDAIHAALQRRPAAPVLLTARLSGHQVMINGHALSPPLSFMAAVPVGLEPRSRWSASQRSKDVNNLDGRRSFDEATTVTLCIEAERRATAAPDPADLHGSARRSNW